MNGGEDSVFESEERCDQSEAEDKPKLIWCMERAECDQNLRTSKVLGQTSTLVYEAGTDGALSTAGTAGAWPRINGAVGCVIRCMAPRSRPTRASIDRL